MRKNGKTKEQLRKIVGVWLAWVIGCYIFIPEGYRGYLLVAVSLLCITAFAWEMQMQQGRQKRRLPKQKVQMIDLEPNYKKLFVQQIQLCVQEKLRKKFPDATVELGEKELERLATFGKVGYVPIKKADRYCHMSIELMCSGEIQMNLFALVSLENAQAQTQSMPEGNKVDVEQWYTQKGQQLLTELITNMNTRGYTELSISENGDVTVVENGRNVIKDRFQEIPPKKDWRKLKKLMLEEDIEVQVSGKQLSFAW